MPVGTAPQKPAAKPVEKKSADVRKLLRAEGSRTASAAKQAKRVQRQARAQLLGERDGSLTKKVWSWAAVSSFIVLIALILAAVYSPLLAIERLSVRGEKLVSEKEIKAALKGQIGKPLPQVSDEEIAKALKRFPLIESFSVISAPPNTLIVKVTERTPIAVVWVDGYGYAFFDPAGVRVGRAENRSNLPTLEISGTPVRARVSKLQLRFYSLFQPNYCREFRP